MTHTHTLKLVPADLDRLHATLRRVGIARVAEPFASPFELLAAVETLAELAQHRLKSAQELVALLEPLRPELFPHLPPAAAPSHGGEGVLSRR